ncbi:dihydroxyacetone kinase, DhaK subunit [Sphaerochaeta pleomorpha str. Grapes]|uniref:Dihydroxyacetone kinase, DhaK subunit n=1 Tax=Sphaerochaeta pleomorpha (strain ATCC BAA-1885 / DSM 22778 / Grapes) TaxID=158190 RepID=G8QX21_SPHPG|nr:dihydroxyacetone kinase subunit DhaK [Sphaerochaeta pleomorpha]AEV29525.1 dihydroxyacetone kinase, DhaK subunit [Sphaerochaeta pleomorpha str. Grapes]
MKKLINSPETLVNEMCNGLVAAYPELAFDSKSKLIMKKEIDTEKVSLISGGGTGHEPAHAGYVGKGMLDVAVCGDVFASPSQIQVYKAIKASQSKKGTLLIIKNYSGDNMNFKNARQLALEDGIDVAYVIVNDDIAVEDSLYTVGRRGVAGTVFVHKIAGAAAEAGLSLAEVKRIAEKTIANTKSLGFALSSCTVPAKGSPTFALAEDEMEFGVGIHGEPGICRQKVKSIDELVSQMVDPLLKELKAGNAEVAIMVNGFGSTPLQELYAFNNSVLNTLQEKNVNVVRVFVGDFMTSLDMAGASLTMVKLDDELKTYLVAAANTPALTLSGKEQDITYIPLAKSEVKEAIFTVEVPASCASIQDEKLTLENFTYLVDKLSAVAIENEIPFCELDSHAGDGDFGMSIAKGFKQLKREWKTILEKSGTISEFLDECSIVIMEYCGGASGPIWGSAFRSAGKYTAGKEFVTSLEMAELLQGCVKAIQMTGERSFGRGAVVGDKTLIDALAPCADSWSENASKGLSLKECFGKGAEAAMAGAKATESIVARMGRAGTVGTRSIGYPDAGAYGLGVLFTEIAKALQ